MLDIKTINAEKIVEKLNTMCLTPEKTRIIYGRSASIIKNYLKELIDKETNSSKLKNKLFIEADEKHALIYTDQIHAIFLEYGTKPHDIYPKRKKALSWYIGPMPRPKGYFANKNMWAMAKHIFHPGSQPKFLFKKTVDEKTPEIINMIEKSFGEA